VRNPPGDLSVVAQFERRALRIRRLSAGEERARESYFTLALRSDRPRFFQTNPLPTCPESRQPVIFRVIKGVFRVAKPPCSAAQPLGSSAWPPGRAAWRLGSSAQSPGSSAPSLGSSARSPGSSAPSLGSAAPAPCSATRRPGSAAPALGSAEWWLCGHTRRHAAQLCAWAARPKMCLPRLRKLATPTDARTAGARAGRIKQIQNPRGQKTTCRPTDPECATAQEPDTESQPPPHEK
jgi:hypothetical protein